LTPVPVLERLDLVASPVAAALRSFPMADQCAVAEIDPAFANTADFCTTYGVSESASANCVVIAGTRGEVTRYAACVVLATMRADVNGVVRRQLGARRASFASMDNAVTLTDMEYGGITPIGLPPDWLLLVSPEVAAAPEVVIGAGVRGSKLFVSGSVLAKLPDAMVIDGVAR
jgi:prolyl-tRNA editing enzyme YbaK/EbsC (Cys-tRNA(Pro) deacylase)